VGVHMGKGVEEGFVADIGMYEVWLVRVTMPPISFNGRGVGVAIIVGLGIAVGAVAGIEISEKCPTTVPLFNTNDLEYVVL